MTRHALIWSSGSVAPYASGSWCLVFSRTSRSRPTRHSVPAGRHPRVLCVPQPGCAQRCSLTAWGGSAPASPSPRGWRPWRTLRRRPPARETQRLLTLRLRWRWQQLAEDHRGARLHSLRRGVRRIRSHAGGRSRPYRLGHGGSPSEGGIRVDYSGLAEITRLYGENQGIPVIMHEWKEGVIFFPCFPNSNDCGDFNYCYYSVYFLT
jgi:hypothetical protein